MNTTQPTPDVKAAVPEIARRLMAVLAALAGLVAIEFVHRPRLVAIIHPLWAWLMGVRRRFASVRLVPVARKSRAGEVRAERKTARVVLAGRKGWLLAELGYKAAVYRAQLDALLGEPEMRAVIDAAPGFGRVLRPVCWMLGISRDRATAAVELAEVARVRAAVKVAAEGKPARRRRDRARPAKVIWTAPPVEAAPRMTTDMAWGFAKMR